MWQRRFWQSVVTAFVAASAVLAMALLMVDTVSLASAAPRSDTVLAWGDNVEGQLGNDTDTNSNVPVSVSLPAGTTVTAIAGGLEHSLALTSTGQVLAWGDNVDGELGNGTFTNSNVPVSVSLPAGTTVTAISTGDGQHSLALTSTGKVLAWGHNNAGQLGNGTIINSNVPVPVSLPAGTTVTAIAAGAEHSLALTSAGQVLAWGSNTFGQLGTGKDNPTQVPLSVSLPAGTTVTAIAAGAEHSLALTSTGKVLAWGDNVDGELGNGTFTNSNVPVPVSLPAGTTVTAVAGGRDYSLALTSTGQVLAWGGNVDGELGTGKDNPTQVPVSVSLPAGTTVTAIAAGGMRSLALTSTGQVLAWGDNVDGELGNASNTNSNTPVPASLPPGTTVTAIAAGSGHSLAIETPETPTELPVTGSPGGDVWLAIALTMTSTGAVLLMVANQWARRRRETH